MANDTKPGPTGEVFKKPAVTFCPYLSGASMTGHAMKPQSLIQSVGAMPAGSGPEPKMIACQGAACELYLATVNEHGVQMGGNCSLSMIPTALNQLSMVGMAIMQNAQKKGH